jgi:hypothetical protein
MSGLSGKGRHVDAFGAGKHHIILEAGDWKRENLDSREKSKIKERENKSL